MTLTTVQNNPFNYVSFETSFGSAPRGGQKALGVTAQFSATATVIDFDLSQAHQEGKLEFVQAIYCDNSANPNSVSIKCRVTEQVLTWAPYTQGYLPCLSTNVNKFTALSTNNYVGNVNFIFLNHPIPADTWSVLSPATGSGGTGAGALAEYNNSAGAATPAAYNSGLPIAPQQETINQTIVVLAANTSALLIAANTARKSLRWMVITNGYMTVAPGVGAVAVGQGMNYSGSGGVGQQGGSEAFTSDCPTNAFSAISAAGCTVAVWEGQ